MTSNLGLIRDLSWLRLVLMLFGAALALLVCLGAWTMLSTLFFPLTSERLSSAWVRKCSRRDAVLVTLLQRPDKLRWAPIYLRSVLMPRPA